MNGWKTSPLGGLCDILDSLRRPITKRDRTSGEYPYYGATGIVDYVGDFIFDEPLVLVGEDGAKWASGESTAFPVTGKCWVNNHAHVLRPLRTTIIDSWLVYYLNHSDLIEFVSGLTVPKLNQGNLREIPIPIPPLAEQQRLVGILDAAFAGLASAKASAAKNLQNARALFESHLHAVFSQRGEGWVERTIGDEVEFAAGYAFKSSCYIGSKKGTRLLRGDNIMQGEFRWEDAAYWPLEDTLPYDRFLLEENDIVLAMDRPWVAAGLKIACVSKEDLPCLQVQRTARLRVASNLSWRYLFHLLRSQRFVGYLLDGQTGLGVPHISGKQILSFRFFRPSLAEQKQFSVQLDTLAEETTRLAAIYQQKLAALEALKKSLLHQAFSGAL
jgi:type I restriction enzyme S subunit